MNRTPAVWQVWDEVLDAMELAVHPRWLLAAGKRKQYEILRVLNGYYEPFGGQWMKLKWQCWFVWHIANRTPSVGSVGSVGSKP